MEQMDLLELGIDKILTCKRSKVEYLQPYVIKTFDKRKKNIFYCLKFYEILIKFFVKKKYFLENSKIAILKVTCVKFK